MVNGSSTGDGQTGVQISLYHLFCQMHLIGNPPQIGFLDKTIYRLTHQEIQRQGRLQA